MDRRAFLSSSAMALAASQLPRVATAQATPVGKPLKLGFLIPRSGTAGLFGPSSEACIELAVNKINTEGGILGRPIEALLGDAGGAPSDTVQAAQRMWRRDGVEAIVGEHGSASREAVAGALRGQLPYVYSPVNEGGYCTDGVFTTGETPSQQLAPAIPYLAKERDIKRWYLIGNDYSWPRITNAAAKEFIAASGGEVVGEEYHPFTTDNFDSSLANIRDSRAEAVLINLVGGASVVFNRAYASFGLDKQALRLGTLIEENTLAGIGAENSGDLYSVSGYFDALDTPAALAFRKTYYDTFGADAPVLNTLGQSCFEAVLFLQAVIEKAGETSIDAITTASEGISYSGPRGDITMSGRFVNANIYLAKAEGTEFKIIENFGGIASGTTCSI